MIHELDSSSSESDDENGEMISEDYDNSEDNDNFGLNFMNELNDLRLLKVKIDILEKKVDRILELLESDCKKLRNHIDFVEHVYDNVKTPFNYVMDRVNGMINITNLVANPATPEAILDEMK